VYRRSNGIEFWQFLDGSAGAFHLWRRAEEGEGVRVSGGRVWKEEEERPLERGKPRNSEPNFFGQVWLGSLALPSVERVLAQLVAAKTKAKPHMPWEAAQTLTSDHQ
jgi:hypothetical protein